MTKPRMLVLFLFLAAVFAPVKSSLATGGAECSYLLRYRKHNESLPFEGIPAFIATLSINASGFYNSGYEYHPEYDGLDGECALVGAIRERSVLNFSFTYNEVLYSTSNGGILFNGPWFEHYPLGVRYSDLQRNKIVENYFGFFIFITSGFDLYNCCESLPCYCVCDGAGSTYCLDRATQVTCDTNDIPFVADTSITYGADNIVSSIGTNANWYSFGSIYILSPQTDVFDAVVQVPPNPIEYRTFGGSVVDLTSEMCPGYCLYFRSTPGGGGSASTQVNLYMGPGLGQGQRLQFQMGYWSTPVSNGPVCIYFDYSRIDFFSDEEPARTVLNKIWCGLLEPYEAGPSTLTLDMPLSYGPAYESFIAEAYDSNAYSEYRPVVVEASSEASFVAYNLTINSMGPGYNYECFLARRRGGEEGGDVRETWKHWDPPSDDFTRYQRP